jgi:hypothetical protein
MLAVETAPFVVLDDIAWGFAVPTLAQDPPVPSWCCRGGRVAQGSQASIQHALPYVRARAQPSMSVATRIHTSVHSSLATKHVKAHWQERLHPAQSRCTHVPLQHQHLQHFESAIPPQGRQCWCCRHPALSGAPLSGSELGWTESTLRSAPRGAASGPVQC